MFKLLQAYLSRSVRYLTSGGLTAIFLNLVLTAVIPMLNQRNVKERKRHEYYQHISRCFSW
jgi:hypothetical protein